MAGEKGEFFLFSSVCL